MLQTNVIVSPVGTNSPRYLFQVTANAVQSIPQADPTIRLKETQNCGRCDVKQACVKHKSKKIYL